MPDMMTEFNLLIQRNDALLLLHGELNPIGDGDFLVHDDGCVLQLQQGSVLYANWYKTVRLTTYIRKIISNIITVFLL